jgi:hypothetical protein
MTIRSKIERLDMQQRRQLSYAFDNGIAQYVRMPNSDTFVGVHLVPARVPHLKINEVRGAWSTGTITKGE